MGNRTLNRRKKMKKTINRLLLAMAVCAGSAYSNEAWEDDRNIITVMTNTINALKDPISALEKAMEAINVFNTRNAAMAQIGELLTGLKVDLSSVSESDNPVKAVTEMKNIAQDTIGRLDDLLNKKNQSSKKADRQDHQDHTASNKSSATGGSRARY